MKTSNFMPLLMGLLLAGCGEKDKTTDSVTGGNPLTAPADYLDAAGKAHQGAVKTVDLTALNKAIELYSLDRGGFPKNLKELVAEKYIPKIPAPPAGMKFEYDANTGKVTIVNE